MDGQNSALVWELLEDRRLRGLAMEAMEMAQNSTQERINVTLENLPECP